jgi:hypothetical protein
MGGEVLLEVKVRHNDIRRRGEKIAKLIVKNDLATVLGMLKTLLNDVGVHDFGYLGTRDEFFGWKS